ncbi:hypothetical protein AB0I39_06135 [Kitasatospora purpeofusca]|uniref:hypothetical protein n=1 Tax=Kitasatospora purpeofusca TaxID=67352 RepID=UPI0033D316F8
MRVKKRGRTLASAAVVAATMLGSAVGTAGTAHASNEQLTAYRHLQCNTSGVTIEPLIPEGGGVFPCGDRFNAFMPRVSINGLTHVFAVGADYAVWVYYGTQWQSLGGRVGRDWVMIHEISDSSLTLKVYDTNTNLWYNTRDSAGRWTGWHR